MISVYLLLDYSPSAPIVLLPPSRCAGEDAIRHQRSGVAGSGGHVVGTHGHASGSGEHAASIRGRVATIRDFEDFFQKIWENIWWCQK